MPVEDPDAFSGRFVQIFLHQDLSTYLRKNRLGNSFYIKFFSNLVGEEGPRIPGVKDSRVCFLKTLSALLTFFRFLRCFFSVYPIHLFQLTLNPLPTKSGDDLNIFIQRRPFNEKIFLYNRLFYFNSDDIRMYLMAKKLRKTQNCTKRAERGDHSSIN
jgi:hypothetical protein